MSYHLATVANAPGRDPISRILPYRSLDTFPAQRLPVRHCIDPLSLSLQHCPRFRRSKNVWTTGSEEIIRNTRLVLFLSRRHDALSKGDAFFVSENARRKRAST